MMSFIRTFLLLAAVLLSLPATAQEPDTFARIREKGAVVMGVRESSPPLSIFLGDRYVGYHVEICERVLKRLVPTASIKYMLVTSQNRIPLLQNGTIDIECGSTSNTAARQQQVAFANTTYITEVRFAVRKDSGINSEADFKGKTFNTLVGSAYLPSLRKLDSDLDLNSDIQLSKDHAESFLALESGRADVLAMDDNILAGSIAGARDPKAFKIIGKPLRRDPIAIMMRKDDTTFKAAVDGSIRQLIKDGEVSKLYDKWFMQAIPPRNITIGLPMSESLKVALANPNSEPAEAYDK